MQYVSLGRTGLQVSRLCLGCMSFGDPKRLPQAWSLDEEASQDIAYMPNVDLTSGHRRVAGKTFLSFTYTLHS
jgi:hypothetical protein